MTLRELLKLTGWDEDQVLDQEIGVPSLASRREDRVRGRRSPVVEAAFEVAERDGHPIGSVYAEVKITLPQTDVP